MKVTKNFVTREYAERAIRAVVISHDYFSMLDEIYLFEVFLVAHYIPVPFIDS